MRIAKLNEIYEDWSVICPSRDRRTEIARSEQVVIMQSSPPLESTPSTDQDVCVIFSAHFKSPNLTRSCYSFCAAHQHVVLLSSNQNCLFKVFSLLAAHLIQWNCFCCVTHRPLCNIRQVSQMKSFQNQLVRKMSQWQLSSMAESGTREIVTFDDCNEMAAACHTACLSTETFSNGQMVTTWLDVFFCIGHVYVTDVVNKFGQVSIWPTDGRDIFWNDHLILHLTDDIGSSLKSTWPWLKTTLRLSGRGRYFWIC